MNLDLTEEFDLKPYWNGCRMTVLVSVVFIVLYLYFNLPDVADRNMHVEPLLFVVDPVRAALDTLGILFIIALFVERANEVFISSTRAMRRKSADMEIDRLQKLVDSGTAMEVDANALSKAKHILLCYRTGTRVMTLSFAGAIATLLALSGVRALSPLIEVQFEMLAQAQWLLLHLVDILLTVAIIAGGSAGVHKLLSTITDQLPYKKGKETEPN